MIHKNIDEITENDLLSLIHNEVSEKKYLDYKAELSLGTDKERKEFLADVSSFANAIGGDLYIGIKEDRERGLPKELSGVRLENPDKEIHRIESLVRDGIEPRLGSVTVRCLKISNGNMMVLIRIPASWASPHRVTLKGHDKFYSRNSAGKYPLDVDELRNSFTLANDARKSIEGFKRDRIVSIQLDETPVQLLASPRIVLHIIPFVSLSRFISLDLRQIVSVPENLERMHPLGATIHVRRYNLDGYLTFAERNPDKCTSYFQLYRNGIIEAVTVYWLEHNNYIQVGALERDLIDSMAGYFALLSNLSIPAPCFIYLTLLGVREHRIPKRVDWLSDFVPPKIGRDVLQLPGQMIESYNGRVDTIMRPVFDALWNACGFSCDLFYGKNDTWDLNNYR